ncbi:interleukin-21 receptor [Salarias fasciatus]|uniref:Interleukin-21 receptor-like n=1 Tax=Salarias fasciatus TaxID=181472 RepID=A0A672H4A1_SALFA|nr:interleukin-21 receptor-like [Salarias fasciatus]
MDGGPTPRTRTLLLVVFLFTCTDWLHGSQISDVDRRLRCVNDYLFTVSCTLSLTAGNLSSYWLHFTETFDERHYECQLTKTNSDYFCTFQTPNDLDTFSETDTYEISLCADREDESLECELLDDDYVPKENIRPNAPCCLAVSHNSSRYHFTWSSTYEDESPYSDLPADLQYELRLSEGADKVIWHNLSSDRTHVSVLDERFVAGAEYSARVRSSPSQFIYMGQWSDWSPELHWRAAKSAAPSEDPPGGEFLSDLGKKVFIPLSVIVLLVLLLGCAPVKKWRRSVFIPTPAPYFDTLYSECKGDFKSWAVVPDSPADLLKAEETLHIDTVVKCVDARVVEDAPCLYLQPLEEEVEEEVEEVHTYNNVSVAARDAALLGLPYAVSSMAPQGGSEPAAGDPGSRPYSNVPGEPGPPWYCNEYCTLSSFQQPGGGLAEQHRSF